MTHFSGEWHSVPAAEWERIEAVIDVVRAWEAEQEHCHDNCPCPHCELIDAVRALDGAE